MKHVYRSETDWFVAESVGHATELCCEHYECGYCSLDGACGWDPNDGPPFEELSDDAPLTIRDTDKRDGDGDYAKETKTCGEWAAESEPGLLSSTEV